MIDEQEDVCRTFQDPVIKKGKKVVYVKAFQLRVQYYSSSVLEPASVSASPCYIQNNMP